MMTQSGQGQAPNTLTFFKNYFVTGDVVAYGVALKGTGTGGFATNQISFPDDGEPGPCRPTHNRLPPSSTRRAWWRMTIWTREWRGRVQR